MRRLSLTSLRGAWFVSVRGSWYVVVTCLLGACHASNPAPATGAAGIEYEAISLLGDTLRRPTFDSTTRERMQADLVAARLEAGARPDDPEALIWVGRRLGYLGRYNAAIGVFSDGIQRFPNDARMYRHRGHRYISIRQFDKAISDLRRASTLMAGKADEVEPDGQPNARGIPIGSLHSNVWYHLALAHYLKGEWDAAARAARSGIAVSTNPDRLVSQTHWLYMALRRAGRVDEAAVALAPIRDDFDVIENQSYYRLVKAYRQGVPRAIVDSILSTGATNPSDASFAYGVANWVLYNGDTTRAARAFEQLMSGGSWASFGYLAAEADVARLKRRR
jgi:tetratricopeptide (TPR) repeat protein